MMHWKLAQSGCREWRHTIRFGMQCEQLRLRREVTVTMSYSSLWQWQIMPPYKCRAGTSWKSLDTLCQKFHVGCNTLASTTHSSGARDKPYKSPQMICCRQSNLECWAQETFFVLCYYLCKTCEAGKIAKFIDW